jgi:hypothetical protein
MVRPAHHVVYEERELGAGMWQSIIVWPDGRTTHTATSSRERGIGLAETEILARGLRPVYSAGTLSAR